MTRISPDPTLPSPEGLARTTGWDLLGGALASDVQFALRSAIKGGTIFVNGTTPLGIFRNAVATAIGRINEDDRAGLFLRILKEGPYEDGGEIPVAERDKHLTDEETATVIAFIFSHMVNCFKGALTELLAVGPCLNILQTLKSENRVPPDARLFVGDAVITRQLRGDAFAEGADLHILTELQSTKPSPSVVIGAVVEVKSYFQTPKRLRRQLEQHLRRAWGGLRVVKTVYGRDRITAGGNNGQEAAMVSVLPAGWTLPRAFHFEIVDKRKFLHVEQPDPPDAVDTLERVGPMEWRVTLRWSKEALDAIGFGMTFWFMEKVGEVLYTDNVPAEWEPMTPAEAGQNAAKQSLYYAILRCRTAREEQRAIALYNSYGFGCALGMNFRNVNGKREMLWPQDLDEILADGKTKSGCRIV